MSLPKKPFKPTVFKKNVFCVRVHRRVKTCLGSLSSPTVCPLEPEDQFEPFEPVKESHEELANAASSSRHLSSNNNKVNSPQNPNSSCLAPSPARSSVLLSSLGTSRAQIGATKKCNETVGASGDMKETIETLGTPHKGFDSEALGTATGLRGSPHVSGGFRGGMGSRGIRGRPSLVGRLSSIDRKWLERCQVFGEMEAEVVPGAGNQEIDLKKCGEREGERETEGTIQGDEKGGKKEMDAEAERNNPLDFGSDKGFENISADKIVCNSAPKPALKHTGKSRGGGQEEVNKKGDGEMERGLTPPPTPEDDNETSHKSKDTKKRARKRQREGENMEGETVEEGGAKKRRRNAKKKEESSDVNAGQAPEGRKKRKAKKKGDEDGEAGEEKETKEPKKVSTFVFISA